MTNLVHGFALGVLGVLGVFGPLGVFGGQVSNFLLFQMAYTEFFFIDKLWPEVTQSDILKIFESYKNRERRCVGMPSCLNMLGGSFAILFPYALLTIDRFGLRSVALDNGGTLGDRLLSSRGTLGETGCCRVKITIPERGATY